MSELVAEYIDKQLKEHREAAQEFDKAVERAQQDVDYNKDMAKVFWGTVAELEQTKHDLQQVAQNRGKQ